MTNQRGTKEKTICGLNFPGNSAISGISCRRVTEKNNIFGLFYVLKMRWKLEQTQTFPPPSPAPSFNSVLLLAGSNTWSEACWEGIFQNVAILSIMSGLRPSSALAAGPAPCQRLYVPHADLQRFWRWTDRPRAACLHTVWGRGGGAAGRCCTAKKTSIT